MSRLIEIRVDGRRLRIRQAQFGPVLVALQASLGENTYAGVAYVAVGLLDIVAEALRRHPKGELALAADGISTRVAIAPPFAVDAEADIAGLCRLDRLVALLSVSSATRALEAAILFLQAIVRLLASHEKHELVVVEDTAVAASISLPFRLP